jgi:hypothetical protein
MSSRHARLLGTALAAITVLATLPAALAAITTYEEFIADLGKADDSDFNKFLPGFGKSVLGTNHVQLYIRTPRGMDYLWLETKDGSILDAGRGLLLAPPATLKIQTSREAIERILQAQNKVSAVQYAIKNGDIRIERGGFGFRAIALWGKWFGPNSPPPRLATPPLPSPPPTPRGPPPLTPPAPKPPEPIPEYPGFRVCDFYNGPTKKVVTCGLPRAAETFCKLAMQSIHGVSFRCDADGLVLCGVPCKPPTYQVPIPRCAFDLNRPRGTQAPPFNFCPPDAPAPGQPKAKPQNCHDTYLPGYRDYGLYPEVRKKWDEYSGQTAGVCVFWHPHRPGANDCRFTVEIVPPPGGAGGNQYLCWYGTK